MYVYHCFFCRDVCLSNLKHAPSRELLLTSRKTVFSHLKCPQLSFRWHRRSFELEGNNQAIYHEVDLVYTGPVQPVYRELCKFCYKNLHTFLGR